MATQTSWPVFLPRLFEIAADGVDALLLPEVVVVEILGKPAEAGIEDDSTGGQRKISLYQ